MKFMYGHVLATPSVIAFAQEHRVDILALVLRHLNCDWGDLNAEDRQANEDALKSGARLFSSYNVPGGRIWVITDAMYLGVRQATTILLPGDY